MAAVERYLGCPFYNCYEHHNVQYDNFNSSAAFSALDGKGVSPLTQSQAHQAGCLTRSREKWHDRTESNKLLLEDFLTLTSGREATLKHDHIYGLLGLLSKPIPDLTIDYQLLVSELYQKAMVAVIETSQDLEMLAYAPHKHKINELPSWCVDYSSPTWFNQTRPTVAKMKSTHTVGFNKGYVGHDLKQGSLTVRAKTVEKVVYTERFENSQRHGKLADRLTEYISMMRRYTQTARELLARRFEPSAVDEKLRQGAVWMTMFQGQS